MLVTPFGMVIDDKLVQPPKAEAPMRVTLPGMVIDDKRVQCRKVRSPMLVMPELITIDLMDVL